MNKRIIALVLCLVIMLLSAACGKLGDTAANGNSATPGASASATAGNQTVAKADFIASDYITLGQYKGVKVAVERMTVTEEDIEAAIQSDLYANATEVTITDRPVQNGDTVDIDFQGMKDGVAFEGGTAEGYILEIGSGYFIEGFEEALIGHSIGESLAIDLTFPVDYHNADLAGQPVVFNVTINGIKETIIPELNDDFVKNNTQYATVEEYRTGLSEQLNTELEQSITEQKQADVISVIIQNAQIKSLPQYLLDYYFNDFTFSYTQYALYNGMDLATFISYNGLTMDDFEREALSYAEAMTTQELAIKAIIEAEKMTLSEEEYNTGIDEIVSMYQYESREALLSSVAESDIRESLLLKKAVEFVADQAVEE